MNSLPLRTVLPCLMALALPLFAAPSVSASDVTFELSQPGHSIVRIEASAPGTDWGGAAPAAVGDLLLDGKADQQVVLFAGAERFVYEVLVGPLAKGRHTLAFAANADYTAPGADLRLHSITAEPLQAGSPEALAAAHAPILFPRQGTLQRFSDLPLLLYVERFSGAANSLLRYSVVFSNEDGGTSTRALMARWGRAVDIEWVYEVRLDPAGQPVESRFQGPGHEESAFSGPYVERHPLLTAATLNNMLVPAAKTDGPRFRPYPRLKRLARATRESVLDETAVYYRVMSRELEREGKLRPFGELQGENVSDPRNYLYLEANVRTAGAVLTFFARRLQDADARLSHLGQPQFGITRSGWVRVAIEMPPGTRSADITEIGLLCEKSAPETPEPSCAVEEITRAFFLGADYAPEPSFWRIPAEPQPIELQPGFLRSFSLRGAR